MPNTHTTLTSLFNDIADAIRAKTGGTSDIVADNFPTAIASIYSTLTVINGTSGSKTAGTTLSVSYTDNLIAGANLYCVMYADLLSQGQPPTLSWVVFTADGTIVDRSASVISVTIGANDDYTVSINKTASSGTLYRYRFSGFALS